jgi:hypothetical protein
MVVLLCDAGCVVNYYLEGLSTLSCSSWVPAGKGNDTVAKS